MDRIVFNRLKKRTWLKQKKPKKKKITTNEGLDIRKRIVSEMVTCERNFDHPKPSSHHFACSRHWWSVKILFPFSVSSINARDGQWYSTFILFGKKPFQMGFYLFIYLRIRYRGRTHHKCDWEWESSYAIFCSLCLILVFGWLAGLVDCHYWSTSALIALHPRLNPVGWA